MPNTSMVLVAPSVALPFTWRLKSVVEAAPPFPLWLTEILHQIERRKGRFGCQQKMKESSDSGRSRGSVLINLEGTRRVNRKPWEDAYCAL